MARYVIVVNVGGDEINVDVSKNNKFVDEASFHISEIDEFSEYMDYITTQILREIMGEDVFQEKNK